MRIRRWMRLLPVLWLLLVSGCASLMQKTESPIVTVSSFKLAEMGLLEQRYDLVLRVQNPNDFNLPIRGLTYTLELNDEKFARGMSGDHVNIPPFGEEQMKVSVTTNMLTLFNRLKNLSLDGEKPLRYKIDGKLSLVGEAIRLPFGKEGEISLK
ncbi:MAG: LEA type 2 family protein [Thiotrichales bacterium]